MIFGIKRFLKLCNVWINFYNWRLFYIKEKKVKRLKLLKKRMKLTNLALSNRQKFQYHQILVVVLALRRATASFEALQHRQSSLKQNQLPFAFDFERKMNLNLTVIAGKLLEYHYTGLSLFNERTGQANVFVRAVGWIFFKIH